jgi:hypothetical protein
MEHQEAEQGRRKKRTRVKYRERVRLKERPKGYSLKRFARKNKWLTTVFALSVLLTIVLYVVGLDEALKAMSELGTRLTDILFNRD